MSTSAMLPAPATPPHAAEPLESAALRRYALLARHGRDIMLFVRRLDGRIVEANDAALEAYGYTRAELLARTIHDLRGQSADALTTAQMAQADARGIRFEAVHRRKDGTTFPVEVSSRGAEDEGDRTLVSVIRDVGERRRTDEALRQGEAQLRTVVENLIEGVVVADLGGTLLHWNRAALEMHGFEDQADCRQRLTDLARIFQLWTLDGQLVPVEEWPLNRVLRGELLHELELQLRGRRCDWARTFSYGGRLVREADGRPIMAMITIRDVTERQQAAAERERLTLELATARRLESVGRLASGVAHDFNNLLAVILSCAHAIQDDLAEGAPASPEDVAEIASAGAKARELTRQLLAFARRPVPPESIDPGSVVRESEKAVRRVLAEDVELVVATDPQGWMVRCDRAQLEHALLNLAVNARDAMPRGGRLTIETRALELDEAFVAANPAARRGPFVRLTVLDTGQGMTPEARAHAFEPFFTTKPFGQGTGLGLAAVYGVVQQAEGFILVESQPGLGTSFQLHFPRSAEARRADAAVATSPGPDAASRW
jgi:PAS domain S-box-containing protein